MFSMFPKMQTMSACGILQTDFVRQENSIVTHNIPDDLKIVICNLDLVDWYVFVYFNFWWFCKTLN